MRSAGQVLLDGFERRGSNVAMPELLEYAGDFRGEAEKISSAALRRQGLSNTVDLTRAGFSLCVRTPVDFESNRRLLKFILLAQFVISLMMVFGGGALAFLSWRLTHTFRTPLISLSLLITVAGVGVSSYAVDIQNWLIRRRLAMLKAPVPNFQPTIESVVVQIEDPQTCHVSKVLVEDHGILYCDGVRRLIVIEGVFHRYVIYGHDVIECRLYQPKRTRHFIVTFVLADPQKTLSLAISHNSMRIEQERQRSKNLIPPPLAAMLAETLGIIVT